MRPYDDYLSAINLIAYLLMLVFLNSFIARSNKQTSVQLAYLAKILLGALSYYKAAMYIICKG